MDAIMDIAARHNLRVLEDAAHAAGAAYKGRKIGAIGHATAFSFYANKNMTTGEGGMITTNDLELADRCRILSLHGISRDAWKRYTASGSWYYEVTELGYKYNMPDVLAAIGLCQLHKLDALNARRQAIAQQYHRAFGEMDFLEPFPPDRACLQHPCVAPVYDSAATGDAANRTRPVHRRTQGAWHRGQRPLHSSSLPPALSRLRLA
jgi:dTDP-4-amino-4,6-dideoxygalactose transaminase